MAPRAGREYTDHGDNEELNLAGIISRTTRAPSPLRGGHVDIVRSLHEFGCELNEDVLERRATKSNTSNRSLCVEDLTALKELGCPQNVRRL